jgi:hypothetical protein
MPPKKPQPQNPSGPMDQFFKKPAIPPKRSANESAGSPSSKRPGLTASALASIGPSSGPQRSRSASVASSASSASTNPGGGSDLAWFNLALDSNDPSVRAALQNLFSKIANTHTFGICTECRPTKLGEDRCAEDLRPMVDNKFKPALATIPGFPQRCSVYTIAMMKAGVRIPERDPPPFPDELRKVLKRSGHDFSKTPKAATWVCSHLCHNKRCINTAHLRWEPSWFNRLRDNCPGGDECVHRPDRCMQAHRAAGGELLDWTKYWG